MGFELEDVPTSVLKVKNSYIDVTTGMPLATDPKDSFIRLLNHESYTIQIPKLHPNEQSRVEQVLDIFSQRYQTEDIHILNYEGKTDDPLIAKIILKLTKAIASEALRRQMDFEDEIEKELHALGSKIESYKKQLEQRDKELEQRDKELEQRDKELEQRDKELEDSKKLIEVLKAQLKQPGSNNN